MITTQLTVETALRELEAAHKIYMQTSVFSEAGKEAKRAMQEASKRHREAVKAAHPDWIVF